jgi:hypothetical protein
MQTEVPEARINHSLKDRHLSRINSVFYEKNYNIMALKRIFREEVIHGRYEADAEATMLVKGHIVVALSLMASGYGRYKLVRDNLMIEDIDTFLNEWYT